MCRVHASIEPGSPLQGKCMVSEFFYPLDQTPGQQEVCFVESWFIVTARCSLAANLWLKEKRKRMPIATTHSRLSILFSPCTSNALHIYTSIRQFE